MTVEDFYNLTIKDIINICENTGNCRNCPFGYLRSVYYDETCPITVVREFEEALKKHNSELDKNK